MSVFQELVLGTIGWGYLPPASALSLRPPSLARCWQSSKLELPPVPSNHIWHVYTYCVYRTFILFSSLSAKRSSRLVILARRRFRTVYGSSSGPVCAEVFVLLDPNVSLRRAERYCSFTLFGLPLTQIILSLTPFSSV
ncbi:hypothetical protein B0T17DRAFT_34542 [Bombardia bombarda]|uniref:Uncharacterized protein n=1 Tax=Bombardia bombarda TaxID=252184 RepID=A0AA39XLE5_9PEZI|nr:hypothetical protein B0T17DRAFT_34542 [Bombardia bombarda]